MRRTLMKTGVLVAAVVALLAPTQARAEGAEISLKAEPGVAFPLTKPQSDRFNAGADVTVKPLFSLTPWLALGPSVSVLALPSTVPGVDAGTAWRLGATAELRRPHDNSGTGFAAVSPWLSAELQYVRTGPLDRLAPSVAAGAAFPTSESRQLWVGPFVKYLDVVQSLAEKPGMDNNDARVLIVGLSLELGASHKKAVEQPAPPEEVKKEENKPAAPPLPEPEMVAVPMTVHGVVQFPFDSAVPLPESSPILAEALKLLTDNVGVKVTLEGHASSEGRVKYNEKLSERRAQAVKDYLVKNGVAADRLTVKGFGPHKPIADNKTETGRRLNRRVEYTVTVTVTKVGGTK